MFALAALMSLITQVSGTPYIPGGDTPAGTDCSGLASWVANVASGRPAFGSRFNTGNMESALLARGFHYGSAPNSVVIGWNSGHAAVTLPDGTPVSSGESGTGVRIGGGGAYQPQFSQLMHLPAPAQEMNDEPDVDPAAAELPPQEDPAAQLPPEGDPAAEPEPASAPAPPAPGDPAAAPPPPAPVDSATAPTPTVDATPDYVTPDEATPDEVTADPAAPDPAAPAQGAGPPSEQVPATEQVPDAGLTAPADPADTEMTAPVPA